MPSLGHYDRHPGYRNDALVVAKSAKCRAAGSMPVCKSEISRGVPWFGDTALTSDDRGVNIAGILFDWYTDTVTGQGRPESELDATSFETVRSAIDDFRISPYITNQQEWRSYLSQLLEYADLYVRRVGGQIQLGQWPHGADIDVESLPEVDNDDLASEPDITPTTWDDCVTKVTVKFADREHYYKEVNSEPHYNPHVFRTIGQPREVLLSRLWITDRTLANRYAAEYGAMFGRPGMSGTVQIKRERAKALGLNYPGALFTLNWATRSLSIVMRVMKVTWPAAGDGIATLTVQSERSLWPSLYHQPPAPTPGNFVVTVPAIVNARVFELPSGLKDSSEVQIAVLAQRPSANVIGFRTHVSVDDAVFDLAGSQEHFAVYGKVAAYTHGDPYADIELFGVDTIQSMTDSQRDDNTLLWVTLSGAIASVGQVIALGSGIYRVYAVGPVYGTTFSIPANAIDDDAWFILRERITRITNRNFVQDSTRYFKLQPFTQGAERSLSDITSFDYHFSDTPAVNSIANLALATTWEITTAASVRAKISATWDAVASDQVVVHYEVGIKKSADSVYQTRNVGGSTATEWLGLLPATSYDVRVRPINAPGEFGLWSLPVTITSHAGLRLGHLGTSAGARDRDQSQSFTAPFDLFFVQEADTPSGTLWYWRLDSDEVTTADTLTSNFAFLLYVTATTTVSVRPFLGGVGGPQRTVTFSYVSSAATATVDEFSSGSGSIAVPSGATGVLIEVYGPGGGGARSGFDVYNGGAGGYSARRITLVSGDWGDSIAYSVGAGGNGRTGSNGNGAPGGNSSVGPSTLTNWNPSMTATGGGGGINGAPGSHGVDGSATGGQTNWPGLGSAGGEGGVGGNGANGDSGLVRFTWTF